MHKEKMRGVGHNQKKDTKHDNKKKKKKKTKPKKDGDAPTKGETTKTNETLRDSFDVDVLVVVAGVAGVVVTTVVVVVVYIHNCIHHV